MMPEAPDTPVQGAGAAAARRGGGQRQAKNVTWRAATPKPTRVTSDSSRLRSCDGEFRQPASTASGVAKLRARFSTHSALAARSKRSRKPACENSRRAAIVRLCSTASVDRGSDGASGGRPCWRR